MAIADDVESMATAFCQEHGSVINGIRYISMNRAIALALRAAMLMNNMHIKSTKEALADVRKTLELNRVTGVTSPKDESNEQHE